MRKLSAEEAAQYDNMIKGAQQMSLEDLQQGRLFGYCRISTPKQKLQRQIDNIKAKYPDAAIITEEYTGTTTNRPAWSKLEKQLRAGDVVVFDEVSRMSRNAAEGFQLYEKLLKAGVTDPGDIVIEVTPEVAELILKAKIATATDNGEALENGCIGTVGGCKIYVSGNIATVNDTTNKKVWHKCMARTRRAIAFAEQLSEIEAYRPEKRFADAVKGLHLYGAKVVYPSELILLDFGFAA